MRGNRKIMIIFCICTVLLWGGYGCGSQEKEEQEQIFLRLADPMPEKYPASMGALYFTQLVREKSNGRIKIEIINEEMGEAGDLISQVQCGGISFARVNSLEVIEEVTELEEGFKQCVYEGPESIMQWVELNQDKIEQSFEEQGMYPIVWYYPDVRCFYSANDCIDTIEDFQGIEIKTCDTNLMKASMKSLGATSVAVDNADVYRSMQVGYVSAGEASFSEFVLGDYYNLVNYVTICDYISPPDVIVASSVVMQDLSEEDRDLIRQCAQQTYQYEKEQVQQFQKDYIFRVGTSKNVYLETDEFSSQIKRILMERVDN